MQRLMRAAAVTRTHFDGDAVPFGVYTAPAAAWVRHTGLEPRTRRRADRQTRRQGPRQLCYSRVWDPLALDRHRVLHRDLKTQNVFLTAAVLLAP